VCGVCVHEWLHKCGGIVFADVWGDIQTCNCVRMQVATAATAATVDTGEKDAFEAKNKGLEEQCKTLDTKYKALESDLERMTQVCVRCVVCAWCVCVCAV
jgi:hypothetical protein